MATTQIKFNAQQIEYLTGWFTEQGNKYVSAVMEDAFEADAESFERLMGSTFDTKGLPRGNADVREVNDKPQKTKRVKKEKKEKDPDAPKRAKTAYMNWLWSEDGMNRVKSENEGIAHKDAMSKAAKEWKAMDDTAKEPWNKMSAAQKKAYETAMETYNK